MNELKIFENKEFGKVRVIERDGEAWFIGKDVAEILEYKNTPKAIREHVDNEDKKHLPKSEIVNDFRVNEMDTLNINNFGMTFINESGLYSLILSSKMPKAKDFKRWVTSEILPSIRKNGFYMTDEKAYDFINNPNSLSDLLKQAADQLEQKNAEIKRMKPKEVFSDAVSTSHSSILIGELAKILKGNGINIGQNRLFAWMRENGYLIKRKGSDYNMPTQKAMESGLFKIKETAITKPDGSTQISKTAKVTGKGQIYFVNKFLNGVMA